MRNLFPLLAFLLVPTWILAQQVTPEVISNAGGESRLSDVQIEWTLGEIAIEQYADGSYMWTEGFHQPTLQVTQIDQPESTLQDQPDAGIDASQIPLVTPNPTKGIVTIRFPQPLTGQAQFVLIHSGGQQIARFDMQNHQTQHVLDMSPWPAGHYVLKMSLAGQTTPVLFRIIKTQ